MNEPIDRAQQVIGRHELVEAKFVEKALLQCSATSDRRPGSLAREHGPNEPGQPSGSRLKHSRQTALLPGCTTFLWRLRQQHVHED
jgi:hypothetical protein